MERYKTLAEMIRSKISISNKGVTLIHSEKDELYISYANLFSRALGILYKLQKRGIMPGEELVFQVNDIEYFIYIFWACLLGKIIPVPVTVGTNDEHRMKFFKIWKVLKKPYLVTDKKVLEGLVKYSDEKDLNPITQTILGNTVLTDDILNSSAYGTVMPAEEDDIAFIQFSSGSTGTPKGVILTHRNLMDNIYGASESAHFRAEDTFLSWMPLTHDMGMIGFHIIPMTVNANQYIMPTSLFIRRPVLWIMKANQHKATVLSSPNFGYKYFLSFLKPENVYHWDLSHVRVIFNGAEPISAELCKKFLDRMQEYGLKRSAMYTVYGMAEACVAVAFPPLKEEFVIVNLDRRFLNIGERVVEVDSRHEQGIAFVDEGYPVVGCSIRICDSEGRMLEDGIIGYVQIAGKNVTSGYYNNEEATEKAITRDGWLITGDLGFIRNGRVVITGRAKEIIFVNGQNVYPYDIERVAEELEEIELGEIAACGIYHAQVHTEGIVLFVLFKKGLQEFAPLALKLQKHINAKMGLEVKKVIPIKKMPKTTSGKIQRYKLVREYERGGFDALTSELDALIREEMEKREVLKPVDRVEESLLDIWKEILGIEIAGTTDNFFELGGTSMQLVNLHGKIEELYPGKVSLMDMFAYPTVLKLSGYIRSGDSNFMPVLPVKGIAFPQEYFKRSGDGREDYVFKFKFDRELFGKLRMVSASEKVDFQDLVQALFSHLLYQITKNKQITIQSLIDADYNVLSLEMDLSSVKDFSDLCRMVRQGRLGREEGQVYPVRLLSKSKFNKESFSVIPFIYDQGLLNNKMDMVKLNTSFLIGIYDLMIGMSENNGELLFTCEYNGKRLKKEKVSELMSLFVKITQLLVKKYSSENVL